MSDVPMNFVTVAKIKTILWCMQEDVASLRRGQLGEFCEII